jgi:hypothetical protein
VSSPGLQAGVATTSLSELKSLTRQFSGRKALNGPATRPTTPLAVENSVGKLAAKWAPNVSAAIAKRWSRRTGANVEGRIESRGVELIYPVGGEPGARARSAYNAPAREL